MKKIFTILYIVLFFTVVALADNGFNQFQETPLPGSSGGGVVTDTNCNQAKYFPVVAPLCKDSSTNLIYTGTGSAVVLVGGGTGCTGNLCAITGTAFGISLIEAANAPAALTLLGAAASNSLRTDTTGSNTSFIPFINFVGNITLTTIGPHLVLSAGGNLDVAANMYDPYGAASSVTPTTLGLVIGTNTQQHNTKLDNFSALANSSGVLTNDGSGNYSWGASNGTCSGSYCNATAGTGVITALGINIGSNGSVVTNGGALGTPSSGNGSNLSNLNVTTAEIAAGNGWVNGGLAPVSGKPLLAGTGANASTANITLQGTAGNTYNLDSMGGNATVAMAIGGNVTGGTANYLLYVGTNSVLAQESAGANVLAALGVAANTIGGFQGTLISGTNIKTVSSHSLVGSGDVALTVSDVANSLSFSGSPTTGHLAQIGAANTIVDGGTGSNLSVNYAVTAGTSAVANAVGVANVTGLGTGVATALGIATNTINGFVQLIASGTANIPTGTIGANASVLLTAANASVVAGEIVDWAFGNNYVGNSGFIPGAQLSIMSYTGSGNVDFIISNNTGANITPAANMTIVWRVRR